MHGIGRFLHSVQSIQFLDKVERDGTGWNLCLETLDGIFCHDGETHIQRLVPDQYKTFKELDAQILQKISDPAVDYMPMTLEGCVVRMADTISYIGRDLEDAIRLNLVKRSDLPEEIIKILGNTNGKIVYNLVTDVIKTSYNNPFASFSHVVSEALTKLRAFNLEHIYLNPRIKQHLLNIRELYFLLFERFFEDIKKNNQKSLIYSTFLKDKSRCYIDNHKEAELVRDFIAGMTDGYFLSQCPESLRPGYLIF
jgi:dGTPase